MDDGKTGKAEIKVCGPRVTLVARGAPGALLDALPGLSIAAGAASLCIDDDVIPLRPAGDRSRSR